MRRLILLGALTFVVGVLLMFPARVAYRWLGTDAVNLSGISGTVWHGTVTEGDIAGLYVSNVEWRIRPGALLTGKLAYSLRADPAGGFLTTDITLSPTGRVALTTLEGALPIAGLQSVMPTPGIGGNVRLQLDRLIIANGFPVAADGTVDIVGLVARGLSPLPIGDFRAVLASSDATITGSIEDVSGMLDVAGSLRLNADRSYLLNGLVAPTATAPAALVDQLRFLGAANERGQRPFRLEGRL